MAGEAEVHKDVPLDASPEEVWDAIATGPGLATWFMPMELDPDSGMVVAWEPGKRLAVRTPPSEHGSSEAFEYLIEARDGGSTVLRFAHTLVGDDWSDEYVSMAGRGWDMYLYTLAEYFAHFRGRPATYVEAEAPPSSAAQEKWSLLLDAVGGRTAESAVELTLPGMAPVAGTVDYLTENFLGIRSTDSLVRFHGRWPLGMPVAVSQHVYVEGTDATALAAAWKGWLEDAFATYASQ